MPSTATRLRAMLSELKAHGLDTDEIAARAGVARGDLFRFSQGDKNALADSFHEIRTLHAKVLGRPPPEQ